MTSERVFLPLFGCEVEYFCDADTPQEMALFRAALERLKAKPAADRALLTPHLFAYYNDTLDGLCEEDWPDGPRLTNAEEVWSILEVVAIDALTPRTYWAARSSCADTVYLRVDGESDWEEEHGISLVFANGETLVAVGQQGVEPSADARVYHAGLPKYTTVRS